MSTLLEVKGLKKYFNDGYFWNRSTVRAVDGVSFDLRQGETLSLVGESGCGKSTTGRSLLRLIEPTEGDIFFEGKNIASLSQSELRRARKDMQIIFQDPYSSLNPRLTVRQLLQDPLEIQNILTNNRERNELIEEMIQLVGLGLHHLERYPHEFSGGQKQRVAIARALILNPKLIVCDEPVSALDVSVQAQIINLLVKLKKELNLSYIFIAHGLNVVQYISDRVAVMYLGNIVELADSKEIFSQPMHPYTKALFSSIPIPKPGIKKDRIIIQGDLPSPIDPPSGCKFHTRCPYVKDICKTEVPEYREITERHFISCHLAEEIN